MKINFMTFVFDFIFSLLSNSTNDKLENDIENNMFDICRTSTENSIERLNKFSECFRKLILRNT